MPYFLLNDITLFYHDISTSFTQTSKQGGAVKNWHSLVANQASKSRCDGPGSLAESARTATSTTAQSKGVRLPHPAQRESRLENWMI